MANLLDLRNKISSTKNTGQITKALEMVSAARQRKAQDFLNNSRFLRTGIQELIGNLKSEIGQNTNSKSKELPKYFRSNNSNKILIIAVMSQRGLCGALNSNLFFEILKFTKNFSGKEIEFISVNRNAQKYIKNFKKEIVAYFSDIPENPDTDSILPLIDFVKDNFDKYEGIYLAYSDFIKSGTFIPKITKLLPLDSEDSINNEAKAQYTIEPDPISLLNSLANIYIDLEIYESILSSQASEHSARMIAMKKATDNAKEVVKDLTLKLNKERQAKITQQMAEISSNI